jgi:MFS family permease
VVFSLAGFPYFWVGGVSDPLADRFGSRRLAVLGMILIAPGLALASGAPNMMAVYAAYGLEVGLGVGCSYVPAMGAVQRWFSKRRGTASGIASSGIGVGTLIIRPLAELLIGTVGWRDAYLVLAALAVSVGAGMVLLVSAIGIGSTAGRFFVGGLADRLGRPLALTATYVGLALTLIIWVSATSFWPLGLFALLFGIAYGGWAALLPAVVMDFFGGRNVSGLVGTLYTRAGFGTLIGPSAAGFAFDFSHSYVWRIIAGIFANIAAAAIMAITAMSATRNAEDI